MNNRSLYFFLDIIHIMAVAGLLVQPKHNLILLLQVFHLFVKFFLDLVELLDRSILFR